MYFSAQLLHSFSETKWVAEISSQLSAFKPLSFQKCTIVHDSQPQQMALAVYASTSTKSPQYIGFPCLDELGVIFVLQRFKASLYGTIIVVWLLNVKI